MSTINIAGLTPVEDPSYRYKMPRLVCKVEGRGNGIKTLLVNVVELAASLNREAPEITKFFGCELGSQTTWAADTERAVVNGAHTAQTLAAQLAKYIEHFVLCAQCKLPETHYKIKSGIISQQCLACGHKEAVDMTHKLTTFILSQHKKAKELEKANGGSTKKDKEKKSKKDKEGKEGKDSKEEGASEDTPKKSKKSKDKSKDSKEEKENDTGSEEEDPAQTEKSEKRRGDKAEKEVEKEEEEKEESIAQELEECIGQFATWRLGNGGKSGEEAVSELRRIQALSTLPVKYRAAVLVGAVLSEAALTAGEVPRNKELMKALATDARAQRQLLAAFEWLCGARHPALKRLFPVLLKALYEEEVVDEEVFVAWFNDFTRTEFSLDDSLLSIETLEELRTLSDPFVTWLQEAEEEEDDEEEEEA